MEVIVRTRSTLCRLTLVGALLVAATSAQARRSTTTKTGNRPISIVACIGPTSSDRATVRQMVRAGASMFRLNMAHQNEASTRQAVAAIRAGASKRAPILCDLPGGKLRTAPMPQGTDRITIRPGADFVLRYGESWSTGERRSSVAGTWVDYDNPPGVTVGQYARPGGKIWLHQGKIVLQVTGVTDREIQTRVVKGGKLSSKASLALMGQDPAFPELTQDDRQQLAVAVKNGATHIGASMIQRPDQITAIRRELSRLGAPHVKVVAKIETLGALEPRSLDAIVRKADEVMIARGDLGVALEGDAGALHRAERSIATVCRRYGKPVMDATGFLSGMRTHGAPTLTNLLDIRHARFSVKPDSIMLKGTAINADPVAPVRVLRRALTGEDRTPAVAQLATILARSGGQGRAGALAREVGVSRRTLRKTLHTGRRLGVLETRGQLVRLVQPTGASPAAE
jgi:pyruvate kinase